MKVWQRMVFILLISLFIAQAVYSMKERSPTVDEVTYLGIGRYLLQYRTWDIQGCLLHPPLSYYIHSVPLFFLNIDKGVWGLPPNERAMEILRLYPDDFVLFLTRIPIVFVGVLLGIFVFKWARDLFEIRGGLFALTLYVFDPNILAHSGLITPDITLTCFIFIAMYYLWKLFMLPSRIHTILAGIFLGLALLSKSTAILLIPIYGILGFYQYIRNRKNQILKPRRVFFYLTMVFFIALLTIIAGYSFQFDFLTKAENRPYALLDSLFSNHRSLKGISYYVVEHTLIPFKPYLEGFIVQWKASNNWAANNYLMGHYSNRGFWHYYFIAFLIKTPIPLIIFFLLSVAIIIRERRNTDKLLIFFLLTPIILIPGFFSAMGKVNTGLRYILPVFPFVYIVSSKVVSWKMRGQRFVSFSFIALGIWYITSSVLMCPYYFAYFNEGIGGPLNGYKYLINSNLNWGQDIKGLAHYLKEKEIKSVYWAATDLEIGPEYYGVSSYIPLPGRVLLRYDFKNNNGVEETTKDIIAISANKLPQKMYQWLVPYKPADHIGYSIYLYDISGDADAHYQIGMTYLTFLAEGEKYKDKFPEWRRFVKQGGLSNIYDLAIREFQKAVVLKADVARYKEALLQTERERALILGSDQ